MKLQAKQLYQTWPLDRMRRCHPSYFCRNGMEKWKKKFVLVRLLFMYVLIAVIHVYSMLVNIIHFQTLLATYFQKKCEKLSMVYERCIGTTHWWFVRYAPLIIKPNQLVLITNMVDCKLFSHYFMAMWVYAPRAKNCAYSVLFCMMIVPHVNGMCQNYFTYHYNGVIMSAKAS